jgi:hypothetical protein
MMLYWLVLSIHIVTAILGLGQVAGIVVLASAMRVGGSISPGMWLALERLVRGTMWSLVVMLLSGVLVEYQVRAYHDTLWFRLSFALFLALGAVQGRTRRALRRREAAGDEPSLRAVVRGGWVMGAIVAIVAVLMEVKPW